MLLSSRLLFSLAGNDTRAMLLLLFVVVLQVLLRVKENEIQYLHKEISCLRNELQFLNTVLCLPAWVVFFTPLLDE